MRRISRFTRPTAVLTLFMFLSVIFVTPAAAEGERPLKLKKGFLKPLKFTYQSSEPKGVYSFTGLSFKSEFKETLGQHPPALETAKGAFFWNFLKVLQVF